MESPLKNITFYRLDGAAYQKALKAQAQSMLWLSLPETEDFKLYFAYWQHYDRVYPGRYVPLMIERKDQWAQVHSYAQLEENEKALKETGKPLPIFAGVTSPVSS